MRLAIDLDNVVIAWQDHWIELYQEWFDKEVDPTVAGTWDACTAGTHFETMDEFFEWFDMANGWDEIPWVPGAPSGLKFLEKNRIPFLFVTARPPEGHESARLLAREWYTTVEFRNANSKQLVKADLWIDDSPHVLQALKEAGKPAIRLTRPWNEDAPSLYIAKDWPEIIEIVKGLL